MKRYLIAGLLVWVPLGITLRVLHFLLTSLDRILLLTGVVAANFFGQRLITAWESILGRIPFVKSIYSSVKQVSDTLLSDKGYAFRKALLIEFPRPGSWTIAFMTGTPATSIAPFLSGEHVSVYVPTT